MSVLYAIDKSTLDGIGNAVRTKKGTTDPIPVTNLADEIASIEGSGGVIIQAGTYEMTDYYCEAEDSGSFAWGSQELRGIYHFSDDYETTDKAFTSIGNDGEWSVNIINDGTTIAKLTPSWQYALNKIVLDEAQLVSEDFKTWYDKCFTKVEDEGSGTDSETSEPTYYKWNDNTTGDYFNAPYPSYDLTASCKGKILYCKDEYGITSTLNGANFTSITLSGNGQGGSESNNLQGAPYPEIKFNNGVIGSFFFSEIAGGASGGIFIMAITEFTDVPEDFMTLFNSLFNEF